MEEYNSEFLTFTVKEEPVDSEEDFIGFEEDCSSNADIYKQFIVVDNIKEEFHQKVGNIEASQERKQKPSSGAVKRSAKSTDKKVETELQKHDLFMKVQKIESTKKTLDNELHTDIEIQIIGNIPDKGIKAVTIYNCDICAAKYTRKSKLRTHILNHVVKGPNELPLCQYCGEVFDSIDKFFIHFEKTHNTNAEDVLITFEKLKQVLCCEYCGNAYAYPESLNKHRTVHAGKAKPYSCQFCDTHFDAYSKLVTHALKHNDVKTDYPVDRYWLCDFTGCSKSLKNITSLNYHKKNVHQKKYMSQCKECPEIFENSWSLHNHMQVKHLGPFPCVVCERSCPTTKLLKRHMLTHTKVESDQPSQSRRFVNYCKYLIVDTNGKFKCKECSQIFDTRKRFRTHVVEAHDKSKNFFCMQCDKAFTLAWQLNSHVENTHVKKFQCTICGVFKNKQSKLQLHMKTHQFPCSCCDKSFSRHEYLESHIKKRHISKLICGNFEQKVLNKCEYVDSNGIRRPQPTKIYVMPGPSPDGNIGSQTPIVSNFKMKLKLHNEGVGNRTFSRRTLNAIVLIRLSRTMIAFAYNLPDYYKPTFQFNFNLFKTIITIFYGNVICSSCASVPPNSVSWRLFAVTANSVWWRPFAGRFSLQVKRTINVNINQEQYFAESKSRRKQDNTNYNESQSSGDVNHQQNLENLAAIAFLESEMTQAAKLLTMPFINK
ncbi:Zinc finger imprinted 3 [Pseudolycoriella hygida]|uniref:Zinc finger imprinted 3 n=1 Tax=Pseudolycoriella hygida TaxID=35572 RepID=A0A9Q0N4J1_9DIPT|nr:Zinc finger imprinted 3 [Pseudolycoriella hygida]